MATHDHRSLAEQIIRMEIDNVRDLGSADIGELLDSTDAKDLDALDGDGWDALTNGVGDQIRAAVITVTVTWQDDEPAPADPITQLREALAIARDALEAAPGCESYSEHGPDEEEHCEECRAGAAAEEAIAAIDAALTAEPTPAEPTTEHVEPSAEQQVRGVQAWMALDLHMALGLPVDHSADVVHQGRRSWGDWWAELLHHVRTTRAELRESASAPAARASQPVSAPTGAPDGTRATAEAEEAAEGNSGLCPCEDPSMRGHLHSRGAHRVTAEMLTAALNAGSDWPVTTLDDSPDDHISFMREGLAAVTPAIEQRVRTQVAEEIEAAAPEVTVVTGSHMILRVQGMHRAARIARGEGR